mmetsp:Transcript_22305/g.75074  ORF Transcript_22305/g.75074 Transcript_22305/m.75074 type:complete len:361 (-) Transcript_22305:130-1212(-)
MRGGMGRRPSRLLTCRRARSSVLPFDPSHELVVHLDHPVVEHLRELLPALILGSTLDEPVVHLVGQGDARRSPSQQSLLADLAANLVRRRGQRVGVHGHGIEVGHPARGLLRLHAEEAEHVDVLRLEGRREDLAAALGGGPVPPAARRDPHTIPALQEQLAEAPHGPLVVRRLLILKLRRVGDVALRVDVEEVAPEAHGRGHGVRGHAVAGDGNHVGAELRVLFVQQDGQHRGVRLDLVVGENDHVVPRLQLFHNFVQDLLALDDGRLAVDHRREKLHAKRVHVERLPPGLVEGFEFVGLLDLVDDELQVCCEELVRRCRVHPRALRARGILRLQPFHDRDERRWHLLGGLQLLHQARCH